MLSIKNKKEVYVQAVQFKDKEKKMSSSSRTKLNAKISHVLLPWLLSEVTADNERYDYLNHSSAVIFTHI